MMKKFNRSTLIVFLLSGSILFSSCIGSFGLFNKVRTWNSEISDNKFVNELVFIALGIVQVYTVCAIADVLVINSIEFWSGSNPMLADVGETKKVKGENGDYLVKTLENGYAIQKEGSEDIVELVFDQENNTWVAVSESETAPLLKLNNDGTAKLYMPDGTSINVTLDHAGKVAAYQAIMSDYYVVR